MNTLCRSGISLPVFLLAIAFASCASSSPGINAQSSSRPLRQSAGNAELTGPDARDLIHQTRRDYYHHRHADARAAHRRRW